MFESTCAVVEDHIPTVACLLKIAKRKAMRNVIIIPNVQNATF